MARADGLSLPALTAIVVGSMVGAGIFSLPQAMGRASGGLGVLLAWGVTGSGMLLLALVFQRLARQRPELDSGIFAYAQEGFGRYPGFLSAFGYWTVCCLGNVSYWVLIKSTLGAVVPAFGDGSSLAAVASASAGLWLVHALLLRGVRQAAALNTIVTVAKILPILLFIALVALRFDTALFADSFRGAPGEGLALQLQGTLLVTVFVFVGIEGASVFSRHARRAEDVGRATLAGFALVLALLVAVTLLSYGILPRAELAALRNPSMGGVLQAVVGGWGAGFVGAGLIVSVLGAYLSWSLLAAEVLVAAARAGIMPAGLARENARGAPAAALWLTSLLVQLFLVLTYFAEEAFLLALKLTSSMVLLPYLLVAGFALLIDRRAGRGGIIALLALLYVVGMMLGGGLRYLLLSCLLYAPGTLLFLRAARAPGLPAFTRAEALLLALVLAGAALAGLGLLTGRITL
ncbi:arginine-ornithine antiporter [Pseudoroseomonas deserti]|uniref:Arginine-ornithine antiporter n=1 Tax=Teichococcus deserti TaxID=1817963 RepID=A0A1V2H2N5_9PROT|nr:basic amino acid/polyamine antiporter [Pseudoroseomonas deserti]ONG54031.1 arginine-ornithine antiporter [Pseudoroseomonas deserti]